MSDKKKVVMIVEDDAEFRGALASVLTRAGFEVRQAENGLVAKTIFDLNTDRFDVVISDIKMPEMNGIDLLSHIKATHPNLKFIIMTGFSEILEGKDLSAFPFDALLPKPFKMTELIQTIIELFTPKPEVKEEEQQDEFAFCRIHVDEFVSSSRLPSDIYVQLSDKKFIRVGKEGSNIPVTKIQTYKEKRVDFFYVKSIDFHKYTGLNLKIAKAVSGARNISREQKLKLYKHTSEILLTQVFIDGIDKSSIEATSTMINNTMSVLGDEPDMFDLLMLMQSHNDIVYTHAVAVSAYSCLIAKKMGWTSGPTLMKLTMAGLFHDIGKKEIPNRILTKRRKDMTPEERAMYETHPTRGRDILSDTPGIPGDVIQICFQHHENNCETGYPMRIAAGRVHPLAKIIYLADEFVHLALKHQNLEEKPASFALNEIYTMRLQEVEPVMLKALMEVFNHPVPTPLMKLKYLEVAA